MGETDNKNEKENFGGCGICKVKFCSREAAELHFSSAEHRRRINDPAIMDAALKKQARSILLGL